MAVEKQTKVSNVDFSQPSPFLAGANYSSLLFGKGAPLLETELNELQDVQNYKMRTFLKNFIGDGQLSPGMITTGVEHPTRNEGGRLIQDPARARIQVQPSVFLVDGYIINVSETITMENIVDGESVYLDVWEEVVDYTSEIKQDGNQLSQKTVENKILDSRVGTETSKRKQVKFTLSKTKESEGHSYLQLVEMRNGEVYTLYRRIYTDKDLLDFINAVRREKVQYTELSSSQSVNSLVNSGVYYFKDSSAVQDLPDVVGTSRVNGIIIVSSSGDGTVGNQVLFLENSAENTVKHDIYFRPFAISLRGARTISGNWAKVTDSSALTTHISDTSIHKKTIVLSESQFNALSGNLEEGALYLVY